MRIALFVIASLFAAPAFADDTESQAPGNVEPSHADPATKTLPATASATAQANAFGQQGARMKAHAAAKNAAKHEAHKAAKEHGDNGAKQKHGRGHSKNKGHRGHND